MLFNSFDFFIFFPLVTLLYFIVPFKFRWLLLLLASSYFYISFVPYYILILGTVILIDYGAGIWIENTPDKKKKKKFLLISLFANTGVLFIFKYYNFFIQVVEPSNHSFQFPYLSVLLPIGLSFHTLQAMSYTIEIYNGNFKAERHIGKYALYVIFYPQLVAGPIERPQHLLPQFYEKKNISYSNVSAGLKRMLWGFFKKLVIADRLGVIVNCVYITPGKYDPLSLLFATYLFTFQIYCDFSGYSDIAIGAAKVMGYELVENFKTPYLSQSIREFWTRWHISLSRWLRDYIYIPLGGSHVKKWKWCFNLLLVFLISGLWHGANITFLLWGLLHAIYLIVSLLISGFSKKKPAKSRLIKMVKLFFTFHMVVFTWIFFRVSTLNDARIIIAKLARYQDYAFSKMKILNDIKIEFTCVTIVLLIIFVCIDPFVDALVKGKASLSVAGNMLVAAIILSVIVLAGYFGRTDFIYFKF